VSVAPAPATTTPARSTPATPLDITGFVGETAAGSPPPGLLDPAHATRTLHWGRNYLWVADWPGVGAVVVKQFRHEALRARLSRRFRGSKARKSFAIARGLAAAGIATPEPLLWADSTSPRGPSWYICRLVDGVEARYPFRALNAGTLAEDFPELPAAELLAAAARTARALHEAGFWHRDLSTGNLLLHRDQDGALVASLVDLNRCRNLTRLSLSQRLRDLARLPVHRRADQDELLADYFGAPPSSSTRRLYAIYHGSFHGRHRLKNRLRGKREPGGGRGATRGALDLFRARRAYPHLPPAPADAALRDRVVWDALSDQPHQHASRGGKLLVRLRDLPSHARGLFLAAAAGPRIRRRYRQLVASRHTAPVPFGAAGVGLRPHPEDPDALLAAVDELGVRHALVRLHPWEERHDDEEALCRALSARGIDVVVALPQRRELVRDLPRWQATVAALGARFAPFASAFQIGQGINRSKWGVWTLGEYAGLLRAAAEALAPHRVPLVGPGVIDFEPHATAAALCWPKLGVRFHALASLLYVDRRGAPENSQLGLDALGKATLLRAIAETSPWCEPRSWITEVNWPLREGPHAPAGRDVAVGEDAAADYLARYYIPLLASGMAERVYWWQLVARGYGLAVAEGGALRRRPAFHALATLQRLLGGATCTGVLPAPSGAHLYRFVTSAGNELVAGWSSAGAVDVELPWRPDARIEQSGTEGAAPGSSRVRLGGGVAYFAR
jgi:tRNA A-37 threonylcarbamoyl transferase component Bud32